MSNKQPTKEELDAAEKLLASAMRTVDRFDAATNNKTKLESAKISMEKIALIFKLLGGDHEKAARLKAEHHKDVEAKFGDSQNAD